MRGDYQRPISKALLIARFRIGTRELQAAQLGSTPFPGFSRIWPEPLRTWGAHLHQYRLDNLKAGADTNSDD
jgi:hypothetical protein